MAMWHVLAGDPQLLRQVFLHLLEVLSLSLPYQEKVKSGGKTTRAETSTPKAVSVTPVVVMTLCCFICPPLTLTLLEFLKGCIFDPFHSCFLSQASNAIGVLCQAEESSEVAKEMLARIFSALMLRIGISVTIEGKKPYCVRCRFDACMYVCTETFLTSMGKGQSTCMNVHGSEKPSWVCNLIGQSRVRDYLCTVYQYDARM